MGAVEDEAGPPPAGLSSSEVNFLVYRYLLESGFGHAAFAFGNESDVNKVDVQGKDVPVGALVSFIQKGFQLVELEANLNSNGTDVYGKYVQFSANDILTKDVGELRRIAEEIQDAAGGPDAGENEASPSQANKKGKKSKKARFADVSALEGANGVAVAEGPLPPLEVEMDGLDDAVDGCDVRGQVVDGAAQATSVAHDSNGFELEEDKGMEEKLVTEACGGRETAGVKEELVEPPSPPPPSPPPPSPPPPSPPPPLCGEDGEQMEVEDALWEKQGATGASLGDEENAPLANGEDAPPPPTAELTGFQE